MAKPGCPARSGAEPITAVPGQPCADLLLGGRPAPHRGGHEQPRGKGSKLQTPDKISMTSVEVFLLCYCTALIKACVCSDVLMNKLCGELCLGGPARRPPGWLMGSWCPHCWPIRLPPHCVPQQQHPFAHRCFSAPGRVELCSFEND